MWREATWEAGHAPIVGALARSARASLLRGIGAQLRHEGRVYLALFLRASRVRSLGARGSGLAVSRVAVSSETLAVDGMDGVDATLGPLVVAHGGQGSPAHRSAAVAPAAARAFAQLEAGASSLDAAVAGVQVMEDDPLFNAGTGANVRLDGVTVECDAAVMDDTGDFGAVAGLRGVRHPVLVAAAVRETPHMLVAGDGANRIVDRLGLQADIAPTSRAQAKLLRALAKRPQEDPSWARLWNFALPYDERPRPTLDDASPSADPSAEDATKDTVGVVVRDQEGRYAAALSTGGTATALLGRVGDVPQYGDGLFAGPAGAVAATGKGEAIIRERVASRVYDLLEAGVPPDEAIRRGIWNIDASEGVGVPRVVCAAHVHTSSVLRIRWVHGLGGVERHAPGLDIRREVPGELVERAIRSTTLRCSSCPCRLAGGLDGILDGLLTRILER